RALELLCARAQSRTAFGKRLAEQGVVMDVVAESRIAIETTRLLTMKAAWLMDTVGNKGARFEIAAIKVLAARTATNVIDRAIQVFGGAGVSQDWPLADMYPHAPSRRRSRRGAQAADRPPRAAQVRSAASAMSGAGTHESSGRRSSGAWP